MIRFAAYWGFVVLGVGTTLLGPALPQVLGTYHLPPAAAGLLFLAAMPGYTGAVLVGGSAGDAVGRRPILLAGALLFMLGLGAVALAPAWWVIVLAQFLIGFGNGALDSGSNALANDLAAPGAHAGEQNLLHACYGLGAILGPLLIGASLAGGHGWRPAFAVGAAGAAALALLFARVGVPRRPGAASEATARRMLALARQPLVLVLGATIGLYVGEEMVVGSWAATYLQRSQGLSADTAATGVGIYWGALAGGRLLAALASRALTDTQVLLGSAALALGGTLLLVLATSAPVALAALAVCGLGFAATFPTAMALAGARFPEATGSVTGLLIAAAAVMSSLLPLASGLLAQAFDTRMAMATCPPCALVILALAARLERGAAARVDSLPAPAAVDPHPTRRTGPATWQPEHRVVAGR